MVMRTLTCVLVGAASIAGCDSSSECVVDTTYDPPIRAADFAAPAANPLWPLVPGTRWVYGGAEDVEVTVTDQTRVVLGITTTVVRDVVTVAGVIEEDTYDWFAADRTGTVWYFGEDSTAYEDGQPASTEGSWEAGVDGARPGIVMHATQPAIGVTFRQEYLACEAEDVAKVVSLSTSVTVPYGQFDGCLQTEDSNPLEPGAREHKFYCPGIGLVLEVDLETDERVELMSFTAP
jgi:hypothetical protein